MKLKLSFYCEISGPHTEEEVTTFVSSSLWALDCFGRALETVICDNHFVFKLN